LLDPYRIRRDFPILEKKIDGKQLIYFDNAATSQKPIQVIEAIKRFYEEHNANIHRGLHQLSQRASEMYEEAHEIVAKFINARGIEEIVFVKNTTEALNLVAYAWGLRNLSEGDEVIVSVMEHHSNFLPWFNIARFKNAYVKVVDVDNEARLRIDQLEEMISRRTKLIAITHVSNVTGLINDIEKIAKLAHDNNARIVVDGAQSVPHMPVDVKKLDIDFLAFSGHKMLGPTGIGVLYIREEVYNELDRFLVGGDTIKEVHYDAEGLRVLWHDPPWRFEAGTPNIAGGVGLAEAVKYLMNIGMDNIHTYEKKLVEYLFKRVLEEDLGVVNIVGSMDIRGRGGIVSFTIGELDPHATAIILDEHGIAVRSGFHCAQPLHEKLGFKRGSVRASFYLYNTFEEIDVFIEVLKQIVKHT